MSGIAWILNAANAKILSVGPISKRSLVVRRYKSGPDEWMDCIQTPLTGFMTVLCGCLPFLQGRCRACQAVLGL